MAEHLGVLREYARRVVVRGEVLKGSEEGDKSERVAEYMAMGRSLGLGDSDLYRRIFGDMVGRDEPKCNGRASRDRDVRPGGGPAPSAA